MAAHPLRHADMERRLAKNDAWKRRRDLLEAKLDFAAADMRLKEETGDEDQESKHRAFEEWRAAFRDLEEFYEEAAREYGLLGPGKLSSRLISPLAHQLR